jgi:hypothetical protein
VSCFTLEKVGLRAWGRPEAEQMLLGGTGRKPPPLTPPLMAFPWERSRWAEALISFTRAGQLTG